MVPSVSPVALYFLFWTQFYCTCPTQRRACGLVSKIKDKSAWHINSSSKMGEDSSVTEDISGSDAVEEELWLLFGCVLISILFTGASILAVCCCRVSCRRSPTTRLVCIRRLICLHLSNLEQPFRSQRKHFRAESFKQRFIGHFLLFMQELVLF